MACVCGTWVRYALERGEKNLHGNLRVELGSFLRIYSHHAGKHSLVLIHIHMRFACIPPFFEAVFLRFSFRLRFAGSLNALFFRHVWSNLELRNDQTPRLTPKKTPGWDVFQWRLAAFLQRRHDGFLASACYSRSSSRISCASKRKSSSQPSFIPRFYSYAADLFLCAICGTFNVRRLMGIGLFATAAGAIPCMTPDSTLSPAPWANLAIVS